MGCYLTSGQPENKLHLTLEQKRYSNFSSVEVFYRGSLIGAGFFQKVKNLPLEVFFKNL